MLTIISSVQHFEEEVLCTELKEQESCMSTYAAVCQLHPHSDGPILHHHAHPEGMLFIVE